ncbi:MAG: DNA repair protein RecO [Thermoleophilia bacterium]
MGSRSVSAEAIVLRSLRFGEADRIVHLMTAEHGRLGAIAKGVRRTRSRLGARIEPLGHVEVQLHVGRGDLATVTGVDLVRSHQALRDDHRQVEAAAVAVEAVTRLFHEHDPSPKAFQALARFLDVLEEQGPPAAADPPATAATDPLLLSFQLKLSLARRLPAPARRVRPAAARSSSSASPRPRAAPSASTAAPARSPSPTPGSRASARCLAGRSRTRARSGRAGRLRGRRVRDRGRAGVPRRLPPAHASGRA